RTRANRTFEELRFDLSRLWGNPSTFDYNALTTGCCLLGGSPSSIVVDPRRRHFRCQERHVVAQEQGLDLLIRFVHELLELSLPLVVSAPHARRNPIGELDARFRFERDDYHLDFLGLLGEIPCNGTPDDRCVHVTVD